MNKTLTTLLLAAAFNSSIAQVTKEEDLVYTNNFFTAEAYEKLKEKPADLKYETAAGAAILTHTSKGTTLYASADLFPRTNSDHYIRDFNLAFDFTFTANAAPDNFLGLLFTIVPNEDIEYKSTEQMTFAIYMITADGNLHCKAASSKMMGGICYTCPNVGDDKDMKKVFSPELFPAEAIPGFNKGGKNNISVVRVDNKITLSINNKMIKEFAGISNGHMSSGQAPVFVLGGKCTVKLENLNETYSHQNASMYEYLKGMSNSGTARLSGSCVNGSPTVTYDITTNYGKPSVKVTWQADPNYNLTEVAYFDFKEGDDYGEYLNRGLSSKRLVMFGSAGEAKNIKINPDEGEISFDFYFNDMVSSKRTENTFTITQQYCTIYISSNQK